MAGQEQIAELVGRLDRDGEFASALDTDSITTLRAEGFDDLAGAAERERDRVAELVDRIYRDDEFRRLVEEDPTGRLNDSGIPTLAIEPLLLMAGAPDEVLERATADVEAHLSARKPATVAAVAAVLGTFAFAQQASAASQPATSAQVSQPALSAQVSQPALSAQVSQPAVTAQVSRALVTAQISPAARAQWHGIQLQPANAQARLLSLLRVQTS
jgi:hypothetical protein